MLAIFILNGRLCDFFHLTLQRYNIFIAVHEYFTRNYSFSHTIIVCGAVIWSRSFGQNRKRTVKIRHYNINILFIYSEQWPRFRNRKWPNDHDQMTTLKMPFTTATTPYSPILSQNTKPIATTPINIWHFSWNQPKISLSLQCQNLD